MRLLRYILFVFCLQSPYLLGFATSLPSTVPDSLYISEHWFSMTTGYSIRTPSEYLGSVYRKFFSFVLTYEFYNATEEPIAYAKSSFFSLTAHFDIYDAQDVFLGAADERYFSFFPTFDIYGRDGYTIIASAVMNFMGTTFTIYDPVTNKKMATLSRSFIRVKNDWTFKIIDKKIFLSRSIDPKVFITILAFQGDQEYWKKKNDSLRPFTSMNNSQSYRSNAYNQVLHKIKDAYLEEHLDESFIPNTVQENQMIEHLELQAGENRLTGRDEHEQIIEQLQYYLNQVHQNNLNKLDKQTLLYILKIRIQQLQSEIM